MPADHVAPELTEAAFERAALGYLERYSASRAQVARVLERRILRAARAGAEPDRGAARDAIGRVLDRLAARGLLDDARFAAGRALSLGRAGRSRRAIADRLRAKGVAQAAIEAALAGLDEERPEGDRAAAIALARRRRLGPFRAPAQRVERRQRDIAALARAGFALALARRVIEAESVAALEAWAAEEAG